ALETQGGGAELRVLLRQRLREERERLARPPGAEGRPRRGQSPVGSGGPVGTEAGCALEGSSRCRIAGASLSLLRRVLQRNRSLLVDADRGAGQVPGEPLRVVAGAQRVGKRAVRGAALRGRSIVEDSRAHQRMPKADAPVPERQQASVFCRL